jgi:hypothetical protein
MVLTWPSPAAGHDLSCTRHESGSQLRSWPVLIGDEFEAVLAEIRAEMQVEDEASGLQRTPFFTDEEPEARLAEIEDKEESSCDLRSWPVFVGADFEAAHAEIRAELFPDSKVGVLQPSPCLMGEEFEAMLADMSGHNAREQISMPVDF